jgi:hypothetical protein
MKQLINKLLKIFTGNKKLIMDYITQYSVIPNASGLQYTVSQLFALKGVCLLKFSILRFYEASYILCLKI